MRWFEGELEAGGWHAFKSYVPAPADVPASGQQGVFRPSINSVDGVTLPTAGLTDAALHRAIRSLLNARAAGR